MDTGANHCIIISMPSRPPIALTIAGSDSGGGAGIQADIKTFAAHGVFGMSVITSITAQNTVGVRGICDLEPDFVRLQMDAVLEDMGADAVKLGMLSSEEIVRAVGEKLREFGVKRLVIDPVMRAKGGDVLLNRGAERALIDELLPLAHILTPNIPEAEALSGSTIGSLEEMRLAAASIKELGPEFVLVKGGHLSAGDEATDVLYDGRDFHELSAERIKTRNTHGTGCTYSASICALLAKGMDTLSAVKKAKWYVTGAIRGSFAIGRGHGPLNHFWNHES